MATFALPRLASLVLTPEQEHRAVIRYAASVGEAWQDLPVIGVYRASDVAPYLPVVMAPRSCGDAPDKLVPCALLRDGTPRVVILVRPTPESKPRWVLENDNRYIGLSRIAYDEVLGRTVAGEVIKSGTEAIVDPHRHLQGENPSVRSVHDRRQGGKVIGTRPSPALESKYDALWYAQTAEEAARAKRALGRTRRGIRSQGVMAIRQG